MVTGRGRILTEPTTRELATAIGLDLCGLLRPGPLRSADRRRRPGGPGRRRLRRLRRTRRRHRRGCRSGRAGRHVVADRELPRLPTRDLRQRAGPVGDAAGGQVRGTAGLASLGDRAVADARTDSGSGSMTSNDVAARAVVIASGVQYRRLEIPGVAEFEGRGVYYAATELEARACFGRNVVVVGGANSAGQAALFLAQQADQVHVLIRRDNLAETMSTLPRAADRSPRTDHRPPPVAADLRCGARPRHRTDLARRAQPTRRPARGRRTVLDDRRGPTHRMALRRRRRTRRQRIRRRPEDPSKPPYPACTPSATSAPASVRSLPGLSAASG